MWVVEAPTVSVAEAAAVCARGVGDQALAVRVRASIPTLTANSSAYRDVARQGRLHELDGGSYVVGELNDEELRKLYTQQMAKVGRPGRAIYSNLMAGALHGLCSYCQYGQAATLDHFVPKSFMPALAIDPWNLVPACGRCNHRLLEQFARVGERELFHPYFVGGLGRWLKASVVYDLPVTLLFRAEPDDALPSSTQRRIVHQFAALGMAELYGVVAARDICE